VRRNDLSGDPAEIDQRAAASSGARKEFTRFCQLQYPALVGLLTIIVGDVWSAEDLAQEALARAWRKWSRVGSLTRPDLWAKSVAMNLACSVWRRRQVAARTSATLARRPTSGETGPSPTQERLREAVHRLPQRQRSAIALRYFADMTVADAAQIMGCREGTVRALTSQAISSLRLALATQGEDDDER
jgi:RNA polymerase sigma-70 factor (sigma-E family)